MHKSYIIAPAALGLALAGCNSSPTPAPGGTGSGTTASPTPISTAIKTIRTFPGCQGDPQNDTVGVININLDDNLKDKSNTRAVNSRRDSSIKPQNPNSGEGNALYKKNHAPSAAEWQPYDVYIKDTDFLPTDTGFLLVRVLTKKNSKWAFAKDTNFFGVGQTDKTPADTVCGPYADTPPNPPSPQIERIAYFYIALDKWKVDPATNVRPEIRFVISLESEDGKRTPIIIDPMVIPWGS